MTAMIPRINPKTIPTITNGRQKQTPTSEKMTRRIDPMPEYIAVVPSGSLLFHGK
jgi:hypothetical protein